MSVVMIKPEQIFLVIRTAKSIRPWAVSDVAGTVELLHQENVSAFKAIYRYQPKIYTLEELKAFDNGQTVSPVQALKYMETIECNMIEAPKHFGSWAFALANIARSALLAGLPGFEECSWEI